MVAEEADDSTMGCAATLRSWRTASRRTVGRFLLDWVHQGITEGTVGMKAVANFEGAIGARFRGNLCFLTVGLRSHCTYRLLAPYGNYVQEERLAHAKATSRGEARHEAMRLGPAGCLGMVPQRWRRGGAMLREVPRARREEATAEDAGWALALTSASRESCACNPVATTDVTSASVKRARQGMTHVPTERPELDNPKA